MKKKRQLRGISIMLICVMLLSMLPVTSFAADGVAVNDSGQTYSSIDDAWNAAKQGIEITMLTDWDLKDRLKLEDGKSVVINMNGHKIDRGLSSYKSDGEVIWVGSGASLTLYGSDHYGMGLSSTLNVRGWSSDGKSARFDIKTGGLVTGGYSSNGAGGIHMKSGARVILENVYVAGNRAERTWGQDGYGGGVMMDGSNGQLTLRAEACIEYNYAAYGGGVYIDSKNCKINMNNAQISNNYAAENGGGVYSYDLKTAVSMSNDSKIDSNSAKEGGGIYFDYTQFSLGSDDATGSVSHNKARSGSGGGVYMEHNRSALFIGNTNNGSVCGITFDGNECTDMGGALYIQQETIAVSNCAMTGNKAKYGGGIYNNNDLNSVSGCTLTGNSASNSGGGIYSSSMNDITLGGKMIIKDNTRSDGSKDDLYLNSSASTAYLVGSPSGQSEIGIRTDKPTERKLGKTAQFYYEDTYFYDLGNDYHVEFKEDKAELWLVKGAKTKASAATVQPDVTVYKNGYNSQDLVEGYFSYPSVVEPDKDLDSKFYYSDGYFLTATGFYNGDPTKYNSHLATMSMAMAMAGFYSNIGNDGKLGSDRTYTYKSQNIERLFTDIGVAPDDIYISESNTVKPGTSSIGVAIGQKNIGNNNKRDEYVLVPVAVRGAGYESEWYGNTSVGESGEHEGFAIAADQVFQQVQNYIKNYGLEEKVSKGRVKFWIAGYSRAGATSNLTAKRLIEAYCDGTDAAQNNQVYAYCFEAPKGGVNSAMKLDESKYYSIHNCINKADAVPLVAPEEMGFIRYGVDHYIPGASKAGAVKSDSTVWSYVKDQAWAGKYKTWYDNASYAVGSSEYQAQRSKMLAQLGSVDPANIYFYDRFKLATINYLGSAVGSDLISELSGKQITQEEFCRIFVRALQSWGFYESYNRDLRKGYAGQFANGNGKLYPAFEDALQTVTKILFSKSAADLNGMMSAAGGTMDRLSTGTLLDIYDDMVGDWTSISQKSRDSYCQILWDVVMEGESVDGKAAVAYLTESEKSELRASWDVLIDVLMRFVEVDYNTKISNWNKSQTPTKDSNGKYNTTPVTEGVTTANLDYGQGYNSVTIDETQVILATLANNATALMEAHYPEINFAWLRSYDEFYKNDNDTQSVDIAAQPAPNVTAEQSGSTVTLTSDKKGAAVFYKISTGSGKYSAWRPYNKPIELDSSKSDNYKIAYTAVYCGAAGDVEEKTFVAKGNYHTVTVDGNVYGRYETGDVVTIDAGVPDDKSFKEWHGDTEKITLITGSVNEDSDKLEQSFTNSAISFKMPDTDLVFTTETVDRVKKIALSVDENGVTKEIKLDDLTINGENAAKLAFNYSVEKTADDPEEISVQSSENAAVKASSEDQETVKAEIKAEAVLNPYADKNIYFSSSTTATINGEKCGISYNAQDGSVTLTASEERSIVPDEYCTVTVECYDINAKKVDTTLAYNVKCNEKLTLTAPSVEDERFDSWVKQDGMTVNDRQVTFTPTGDMTITANYKPVVKKIDITIPEPAVGEELPASITSAKVTITNEYDIPAGSILTMWINWLDSDFMDPNGNNGKVVAGDWYAVALIPMLSWADQENKFTYNYTLADNVELTVNGKKLTNDFLLYDGNGDPTVFCIFQAGDGLLTLGDELLSIEQPDTITLENGQALSLKESVNVNLGNGSAVSAPVEWDSYSYDRSDKEMQSFTVTGKVKYSNNPYNVDTTVKQKVVVNGAERTEAPEASLESGTYADSIGITLESATKDAAIYYTLDGSDPTTSSTKYDGNAINISSASDATKLKAIAVKAGMSESLMSMYSYDVIKTSSGGSGSSGKSDKPAADDQKKDYSSCDHGDSCDLHKFTDLNAVSWYHDGIHYCLENGLMNGYADGTFGPDKKISRAQIVTILWRQAGSPSPEKKATFSDSAEGSWYSDAVSWAAETGIVTGYGNGTFGTNDPVTREQLASMLYRYAKLQNGEINGGSDSDISGYNDAASVSSWAVEAMEWACNAGIINGVSGSLLPAGSATRAQTAAVFQRMCENILKKQSVNK